MSRTEERFAQAAARGEGGLVAFVVAGHPDADTSADALAAIAAAGADVIELGVPFSDPLADGPVIQAASQQALANGMTPRGVLEMVRRFRRNHDTPAVLMTCYNPIWQFGVSRSAEESAAAVVWTASSSLICRRRMRRSVAARANRLIRSSYWLHPVPPNASKRLRRWRQVLYTAYREWE
jgi:tryptophan synthase alpha subunit